MVETVFALPPCRHANDIAGGTSGDAKADDLGAERFCRRHLQSEAQARGASSTKARLDTRTTRLRPT